MKKEIYLRVLRIIVTLPTSILLFPYFEESLERYATETSLLLLCSAPILFMIRLIAGILLSFLPLEWIKNNPNNNFSIFSFFDHLLMFLFFVTFITIFLSHVSWTWVLISLICLEVVWFFMNKDSREQKFQ